MYVHCMTLLATALCLKIVLCATALSLKNVLCASAPSENRLSATALCFKTVPL